ncbi:response regulator [Paenibacillus cremeus]|nr:response regulator [Paenibacillus cremeus]
MRIRTKLLVGFSTKPFLIILLISISWYQISSLRETSSLLQQNHQKVILASEIQRGVKDEVIGIRNLFLLNDKVAIEQELLSLQAKGLSVDKSLSLLDSSTGSAEQKNIIEDLKATNQAYKIYRDKVVQLFSQGQRDAAISLINGNSQRLQEDYIKSVDALFDDSDNVLIQSLNSISNDFERQLLWGTILSLLVVAIGIGITAKSILSLATRLKKVSNVMINVANGSVELNTKLEVTSNDEIDDVARSFNTMTQSLEEQAEREKKLNKENEEHAWIKSNVADIATGLSGIQELQLFSQTLLTKVTPLVRASQAIFYIIDTDKQSTEPVLKLLSSYAYKERNHIAGRIRFGEGLVGQAAYENTPILLTNIPADYIRISSGLGEAPPQNIYVLPVSFEGKVIAVVEIASLHSFIPVEQAFLDELIGNLGIILDNFMRRIRLAELLEESQLLTEELQVQSEELQTQQEELKAANEELEEQTQALRQSEEKLQVQQEELEQTNAELREKASMLEIQNLALETTNMEIERARADLEEKAKQLTLSSRYKSEFLANMSHELRTPLNSLLILSKLLADNQNENLSPKQIQFAETIYSSGCDLLTLINEILDLSKIESGKIGVNPGKVQIKKLADYVDNNFRAVAQEKNIGFNIILNDGLPDVIYSDEQRIQQILKNLLSNAFKFTHQGEVTLKIEWLNSESDSEQPKLIFTVTDTGIGIPIDKQDLIFEAFHQADGTTSRKYGGTGLGLTICREIAYLLGGEIVVVSQEGRGSSFSLIIGGYLGIEPNTESLLQLNEAAVTVEQLDNKPELEHKNTSVIDRKSPPQAQESSVSSIKRLLIVDDDLVQRNSLMELIGDRNVIITAVSSAAEAKEELKVGQFDCMVLDLGLPGVTGFEFLDQIKSQPSFDNMAVFIYTGRELTSKEEIMLKRYAHTIIIKDSHSPQRLMEELKLILTPGGELEAYDDPNEDRPMPDIRGLEDRNVLLVDDDVRNVFAISNVLEMYGMQVTLAENGLEAVKILEERSDFDLVLMDIMMPEMDGYEATRVIRSNPQYSELPIIALTAKAMKEDREKCIESGASDYIVKPVIPEQLISLVKVWVCPEEV